jgi:hypothetical protein
VIAAVALFFFEAVNRQQRAVDFLAAEVPKWRRENHCYSCHNNGDGARALFAAARRGYAIPRGALDDTTSWLLAPARWDHNPGTPGFNNAKLARIQFAAALAEAFAGGFASRTPLLQGARLLVPDQDPDGAWKIDTGGAPGAPATYGTALATYMARHTLETADRAEFAAPIAKANRWFASGRPGNILDAAAMLLALPRSNAARQKSLDVVLNARTSDGGWGPQIHAPAEPFDTAVVLLALDAVGDAKHTAGAAARGRAFLAARQQPDGSWPETTRPAGHLSYAEHISTSGWVVYALLGLR